MSEITHRDLTVDKSRLSLSDDGRILKMNKRGTVTFSVMSAVVTISTEHGVRDHLSSRGVINTPHGAKVLPFFKRGGEWYIVMVEQFRIALPGKTLEAPGGEVDEENVLLCMARELEEEARINVRTEDIQLVFRARVQPSMMNTTVYGGIVEIAESQLPQETVGGEWMHGEYTVLAVRSLIDVLKGRDSGFMDMDLETYLLLDCVAKRVGLLAVNY